MGMNIRAKGTPKSSVLFWIREKEKDCGVFDCKVHKQKRHVKAGLFRMVTFLLDHDTCFRYHVSSFLIFIWLVLISTIPPCKKSKSLGI